MKPQIKSQKSEEVSLLETQAARIGSRTSTYEQEQGRNSTIDEDTSAAYPRRQLMVEKMTTISKDDGKSVHASESQLNDSELPSIRRTVKGERVLATSVRQRMLQHSNKMANGSCNRSSHTHQVL